MNLSLSNKNALVCGSSQGIGKAAAIEIAELGATITLLARNEERLKNVLSELPNDKGQQHNYLVADFSDAVQVRTIVADYMAKNKSIFHILINNTGGPKGGSIVKAAADEFLQAYNNHLICSHLLAQTVLAGMKTAGYGRIINITSTSVKAPIDNLGVSNTTRWAMTAWAKTWANEVSRYGITVNNVLPGFTATQRLYSLIEARAQQQNTTPEAFAETWKNSVAMKRFGEANEIGAVVAFLASPAASYISGTNITVDGGRTRTL